jgi:hypothetical protein
MCLRPICVQVRLVVCRQETASERKLKQSGQVWLAAAGAAVVAYVILSGQLASSEYEFEDDDDEE